MIEKSRSVEMMSNVDPYLYQLLNNFIDRRIVIQTTRNSLQGQLKRVFPDHIVLSVKNTPFYVRTNEIIWVSEALSS